jgi:hypothetical protein
MELSAHTLMAIYAHPDDEAFGTGGTLAQYAADPDCLPDQLAGACHPHRVSKVYYRVLPEEQVAAMLGGTGPRR